ncbi:hypothetical protein MVEN_01788900 [Mycena venus]|uniref:Uncharacterized protein n=1 Tax=Mycena venus TaxID=2733690 RepID=A0A8H6XJ52_9AGAR|nr:hypothetical protein MVEN_01788900 [Mycena venus]
MPLCQFLRRLLHRLRVSGHSESSSTDKTQVQTIPRDIAGVGNMGSNAFIGGEGGEGEGPKLHIDPEARRKIGNICGGTGGAGGVGVDVGGKGGVGKGPVISALRRNKALNKQTEA